MGHEEPDLTGHAPRALVGHAQPARQLHRGDAVLLRGKKEQRVEPQRQRRRALVEDRPRARREERPAGALVGPPAPDGVKGVGLPALRALGPLRAPQGEDVGEAGRVVGELRLEGLDGVSHLTRSVRQDAAVAFSDLKYSPVSPWPKMPARLRSIIDTQHIKALRMLSHGLNPCGDLISVILPLDCTDYWRINNPDGAGDASHGEISVNWDSGVAATLPPDVNLDPTALHRERYDHRAEPDAVILPDHIEDRVIHVN